MSVTVRFAPSPTGFLHIGNARPALMNWLFALRNQGRFVLRYDDTDRERSTAEFAEAIAGDLAWLGIAPQQSVRQSDRIALYDAAAEKLRAQGLLYACYETADELDRMRMRAAASLATREDVIDFVNAEPLIEAGVKLESLPRFPGGLGTMEPNQWYFLPSGEMEPHHGRKFPFPLLIRASDLE